MNPKQLTTFRSEYTKLAAKKKDERTFPISRALKNEKFSAGLSGAQGAIGGGLLGAALAKKLGGKSTAAILGTKAVVRGALGGAASGALASGIVNAISSRATLGRARKNQKGIGGSEQKIIKALRATESGRKGSSNPISRALTSVPGMAAIGASPGLFMAAISVAAKRGRKDLLSNLLASGGLAAGGAATAGGATALGRVLKARGHRGENRTGRKKSYSQGLFKNDTAQTNILKALKKARD